jgi:hypothetical protein
VLGDAVPHHRPKLVCLLLSHFQPNGGFALLRFGSDLRGFWGG